MTACWQGCRKEVLSCMSGGKRKSHKSHEREFDDTEQNYIRIYPPEPVILLLEIYSRDSLPAIQKPICTKLLTTESLLM